SQIEDNETKFAPDLGRSGSYLVNQSSREVVLQCSAKSYWHVPTSSCIAAALGRENVLRVGGLRRLPWQEPRSSMKIRVGFEITYDFAARTPMMLMLNVHPSRAADVITPDQLRVSPAVPFTRYL